MNTTELIALLEHQIDELKAHDPMEVKLVYLGLDGSDVQCYKITGFSMSCDVFNEYNTRKQVMNVTIDIETQWVDASEDQS